MKQYLFFSLIALLFVACTPNNSKCIHYTATAKVEAHSDFPWTFDTFGANVVSNEWDSESGEGVITFDTDVTTIGYMAFYDCDSLTSITIPDSVTTIGKRAFRECDSLTSITIGDSVTTIGKSAFYVCDSLTSITIGDSVTTIGDDAFYRCSNLTSITIPDSVTSIGEGAFSVCGSLTEFNGKFASEDGRCLIVDGTLNSFAPAGLTSYTIPDSVTTIGKSAFYYCDSLTSITIGDSVTTIGKSAFYYCDSLTSVTIGDSVTTIGSYAFFGCDSLTSVTIPDSVTTIGEYAFYRCSNLTSITIPDSVTTIGNEAFYSCASLTSVTIPDSVTSIGDSAFYWCDSLTSVYCEATTPPSLGRSVFKENASGRKIYVPAESVEAYKTAEYWSDYARYIIGYDFENGVVVEPEVYINNVIHYTATAKVEAYTYYPWTFDTFGANIVSNEWDSESGEGVITFDTDVTTIGYAAFYDCTSLTSVTIPDSVTTIGGWAFRGCDSLTSITIPDSVTTIGDFAFVCCESLTSITISDSVKTIGEGAFYECYSLTSIYCEATTPPSLGRNVFEENASGRTIYVPEESVRQYKIAEGWREYADYIIGYDFE